MIRFFLFIYLVFFGSAWAMTDIQSYQTPKGTDIWLVQEHTIPFVALELRFSGGTSLDPFGKRGVTNLMMGLLEEGSGDMDAQAFAAAKETLAATFSYGAYADTLTVSAKFLTENQEQAIELLRQSLIAPRFDEDAIERVRAQVLAIIRSDEQNPNHLASQRFYRDVFPNHPYGSDAKGTKDSILSITAQDLRSTHLHALRRDHVSVSAVGDIDAETLGNLVDRLLSDLPVNHSTGGDLDISPVITPGTVSVDFPSPQSVILFGHHGISRDDPDYFAAYILNSIIGGSGFESRLMQDIREEKGLTYGVYTYLANWDNADLLMGSLSTANENVDVVIELITQHWHDIVQNGINQQEHDRAVTYLTGEYPLRFDGNGPIANILAGMQRIGLPIDYVNTRNDQMRAVTLDDLNRVAKRLYDPTGLKFVIVGPQVGDH